ncbi:MAG: amino acid permease [Cryobacterium sp.]|uniref:APC family permease n=1 Tax=unclassified Cryobacterium TaxID=2649013 RepID=UPI0018C943B5|nr:MULTISPECIES: amino acid permease [unclassified Cryobacterium]MCY7404124.1 amino acid permease [Cryobacterium sp.]MEC5154330.1 amino acid transporter [Cryobacterium sp. CAN_C3]
MPDTVGSPAKSRRNRFRGVFASRGLLLVAFAFSVMADPVSSVAYAVEAALRALGGDLSLLLATMGLVMAIIALVIVNYRQLINRYPKGGGASAAVGEAFGDGWSFIPIGALVVDFVLTIAVSVSAGASAAIAYFPSLAPWRVGIAIALLLLVAGVTLVGHLGRVIFAGMTLTFIVLAALVLIYGLGVDPQDSGMIADTAPHMPILAVLLAFPVAMALATGVEAPSTAIAELGQLDDAGRRRFGRLTLWLTLGVVGTITIGLALELVHLQIGVPGPDTTQIAELARVAAPAPVFAAFQLATALLLLAAASSSFQAGPGMLKALARHAGADGELVGILPAALARTNGRHAPVWGVVLFTVLAVIITIIAGANDQNLVLYYAVAVFLSFLGGLLAMARFSFQEGHRASLVLNLVGAVVVLFTLIMNLSRGLPLLSLGASLLVSLIVHQIWVRAGKPEGARSVQASSSLKP